MRISELAERAEVTIDTIRFYEKKGLINQAHFRRLSNGYRDYNDAALERVQLIRSVQTVGFSLTEILELFEAWDQGALDDAEIEARLRDKLAQITLRIAELEHVQRLLEAKISRLPAHAPTGERDFA